METKKEYINRIFLTAKMRGICKTQGDFAGILEVNAGTLSKALQGDDRYLTDNLVRRVKLFEKEHGLEEDATPAKPTAPDIVIPAATAALYNNMSETIRIQAEIIARLQGTSTARPSVQSGAPQKSTRIEL